MQRTKGKNHLYIYKKNSTNEIHLTKGKLWKVQKKKEKHPHCNWVLKIREMSNYILKSTKKSKITEMSHNNNSINEKHDNREKKKPYL